MAALDRGDQIVQRRRRDLDQMRLEAQPAAGHAARIAQRLAAVEGDPERQGVQRLAAVGARLGAGMRERLGEVVAGHGAALELELDHGALRARPPGRDAEHDLAQRLLGLLLGLVDHRQDRGLGGVGIDDLAGAQALGQLIAGAPDLEPAARAPARDQAAHLGGADIEHPDRVVAAERPGLGALQAGARVEPQDVGAAHAWWSASTLGSSRSRTRSGRRRRSTTLTARSSSASSRALTASRCQAPNGSCSGSMTST